MSVSSAVSVVQRAPSARPENFTRAALTAAVLVGMLTPSTRAAAAQVSDLGPKAWELRITGGGLVPTGTQRSTLQNAQATAVQMSWLARPTLAITGTIGWARSRDLTSVDTPKLDVFMTDLGFEVRPTVWHAGRTVTISPFAGLGAGVRSYNYRNLDVDATHNLAGYATAGGEIGIKRVGIRLEARDYLSSFKPLAGAGSADTRNDVSIMLSLRFNVRRASQEQ